MGGGTWSADLHDATLSAHRSAGTDTFAYSARTKNTVPITYWAAHKDLDPRSVKLRESRDSIEHPTSLAIGVLFDVTGSMGSIPRTLQEKLPQLLGLLVRKGYVPHPQIMFGGIGDAYTDRVPLQIGQFESDNRMDDNLGNILLEGGGGGQKHESYELALYFMARHTSIDCWEKRGHKGYLFIIGDEMTYPDVNPNQVRKIIGDNHEVDITTAAIVRELRKTYEVFFLLPKNASYGGDEQVLRSWRSLLGENVLELDDEAAVCETIALSIATLEGDTDTVTGMQDLVAVGADHHLAEVAAKATAHLKATAVAVAEGGSLKATGDTTTRTVRM